MVPETTVPAAANAPFISDEMLDDALRGQASVVVVVEAVVVTSHPLTVDVEVWQVVEAEGVEPDVIVVTLQVTKMSSAVLVLVQELELELELEDDEV